MNSGSFDQMLLSVKVHSEKQKGDVRGIFLMNIQSFHICEEDSVAFLSDISSRENTHIQQTQPS